ncbi:MULTISPECIES: helix-turn-helix domain-containing protein [unclassified Rhizobium]|uniref:helix-turn-helix domain-containing protein n=1 Tax=unclassified Rhizobium TaxID=2613769 RepID=UPI001ADB854B|nr:MULTISPECIES: AraC family transcriptional regulator [unclassified Rhizobium]MBO9127985.1 helix-turn-helix transcriptional regulator [Rhizobium sp. 16-488-2b]MBO9178562.1 helix-turn-helix transcriptional regulator [Rhizobium sp. 16-488-2a]
MDTSHSFSTVLDRSGTAQFWQAEIDFRAIEGWPRQQSVADEKARPAASIKGKVTSGLTEWQRKKIVRYVDENVDARLRVIDLSEQVRLSVSRFSKGFNVTFGRPPYDYVLSRRIEAAKYLIASTQEPLSQIAHACGLSDQAHLSKVFKRLVGTTPLKWRKNASVAKTRQWDYLATGTHLGTDHGSNVSVSY